jgi:2-polyprenyl-3-methyl-5-hydroxy-6-metoxy-1,4-benzoquinol methylase
MLRRHWRYFPVSVVEKRALLYFLIQDISTVTKHYYRSYVQAESMLTRTFTALRHQHQKVGHDFIKTHWRRYVNLIMRIPLINEHSTVLEIGASILSNVIKREFKASVHTIYHELEPEWPARFAVEGITCYPCEMMRDPLPVADSSFDVILFDEVMEHFPLRPEFVLRQIIGKLKPEGRLIFSVPNFATSEKRLDLLREIGRAHV